MKNKYITLLLITGVVIIITFFIVQQITYNGAIGSSNKYPVSKESIFLAHTNEEAFKKQTAPFSIMISLGVGITVFVIGFFIMKLDNKKQ